MDNKKQYFWGLECKEVSEEEYNRLVLQHRSPTHAEEETEAGRAERIAREDMEVQEEVKRQMQPST